jgi:prolyl 4-hydroxylase
LKVKPKRGDAVLFWSTSPDLTLDTHALHGSCPVLKVRQLFLIWMSSFLE